ncbi:MAG TPA: response regulator [Rhodospirillales bacterium]|nr:response regulator [Rhodospirillales bacterium]
MHLSPNPPSRIFIIGYTSAWRLELTGTFREQGFVVSFFEDARLAAYALTYACPDAVVMDWAQAGPLGSLEFIERYGGLMPVLILTRHAVLIDVVQSLRAGAADYIRLPCFFPEILARVERAQAANPATKRRCNELAATAALRNRAL